MKNNEHSLNKSDNTKDKNGYTPLMYAINANDQTEVTRLLANKDIDLSVKDNDGNTALMIAAYLGHISIVRTLLEKGAKHKLSFFDHYFYTPSVYNILKSYASNEELAREALFALLLYITAFSVVGIFGILFIPVVHLFITFAKAGIPLIPNFAFVFGFCSCVGLVAGLGLYVVDLSLRMFLSFHPTERLVNNSMPVVNSGSLEKGAFFQRDVATGQLNQKEGASCHSKNRSWWASA